MKLTATAALAALPLHDALPISDLYVAEALCRERGCSLQLVEEAEEIDTALGADTAVLMLTHVNYRTGAMHDMAAVTARAHAAGRSEEHTSELQSPEKLVCRLQL